MKNKLFANVWRSLQHANICLMLTQVAKNQFGFATAILWH
jgi:hypothetical protein